eukprot:9224269-Karenia_brevis.AAC.1
MMTGFPKTSPLRGRKCNTCQQNQTSRNYLEFGAGLGRIGKFSPDQVSFVPIRNLPNTRQWSG